MIVQVTTTGNDLGSDQFNLAIPGGGEGSTAGCTKQYGADVWGADFGGVAHRDDCDALPAPLQPGCYWRFDWFRNADNPSVSWEKVSCPEQLSYMSNCRRVDDPVAGKPTPTPTPTASAPISSGTVQPGGQCGGKTYRGPTRCVGGTVRMSKCTHIILLTSFTVRIGLYIRCKLDYDHKLFEAELTLNHRMRTHTTVKNHPKCRRCAKANR